MSCHSTTITTSLLPRLTEQVCRLYATKHLRVLLRAGVEFFSSWGMELLVTQLHDHSKAVSMEALDILDEACEDKVMYSTVGSAPVRECERLNLNVAVEKSMQAQPPLQGYCSFKIFIGFYFYFILSFAFRLTVSCCFSGQPPCSHPAETSSVPPGRQRPPAAPQVSKKHISNNRRGSEYLPHSHPCLNEPIWPLSALQIPVHS